MLAFDDKSHVETENLKSYVQKGVFNVYACAYKGPNDIGYLFQSFYLLNPDLSLNPQLTSSF